MFLIIAAILIILLYLYGTRTYNYWSERRIPHRKPVPFFGNNFRNYIQKESHGEFIDSLYKEFPEEDVVGYYRGTEPRLVIRDPDIVKCVLVSDFPHFYARGEGRDIKLEPCLDNPFHADGARWKAIRQRMTPSFTTGKLKAMFPLIIECTEQLEKMAEQKCETGEQVDAKDIMARFTTDFIGACAFGIKINSINEENSHFRQIGKRLIQPNFFGICKHFLKELFPTLCRNVKPFDQGVEDDLVSMVKSICEQRNNKPIGRNDFIDLLLELKFQGEITIDSTDDTRDLNKSSKPEVIVVDINFLVAQVFVFFVAGFETSSSATSYTLHQLAYNPDIQRKVQQEIDEVLKKHDNKLSYEAVKEMHYLERTLSEGMRMFPTLSVLNRMCTKNFKVPNKDIVIENGIRVIIPVGSLHNDKKYWKNPEEFDPDRFLPEAVQARHKFVYLPFGEGPRACIGTRLGQMQSMAGLAALLRKFTFKPVPPEDGGRKQLPVDPKSNFSQSVLGGIPLIITRRN